MDDPTVTKSETFFQAWSASLAALFSQLTAETWSQAEEASENFTPHAVLRVKLGQELGGCFWMSVKAEGAALMLELFTGEKTETLASLTTMQAEALTELARQWAGLAATQLKPTFGEVSAEATVEAELPASLLAARGMRIASGNRSLAVQVGIDAEVLASFNRGQASATAPADLTPQTGPNDPAYGSNLDLALGVELGVTLHFGSCQASLREVMELASGAVLELNRDIGEPVDLMLDDRVIARGDMVVVDGCYGLRIAELNFAEHRLHPQQGIGATA